MRLATASVVLGVLGTQVSSGSLATAESALDATFPIVEAALETTLARGRCVDHFDLSRYEVDSPLLRLSRSFVSKKVPIVVMVTGQATEAYSLDHDTGILAMRVTCPAGRRVLSVAYSYGFDVSAEDVNVLGGLPQGVAQAGVSMAATYLLLNPANVAKDKARFATTASVNGLEMKARQACSQYVRPRGTVVWPAYTAAA